MSPVLSPLDDNIPWGKRQKREQDQKQVSEGKDGWNFQAYRYAK